MRFFSATISDNGKQRSKVSNSKELLLEWARQFGQEARLRRWKPSKFKKRRVSAARKRRSKRPWSQGGVQIGSPERSNR